jgi:hypothetical protein
MVNEILALRALLRVQPLQEVLLSFHHSKNHTLLRPLLQQAGQEDDQGQYSILRPLLIHTMGFQLFLLANGSTGQCTINGVEYF